MKILIVAQTRTKSTALTMYIKCIYSTLRLKKIEFYSIPPAKLETVKKNIKKNNIVVRMLSHNIVDPVNKEMIDLDSLNFEQYDQIYFCNRENSLDGILSAIAREHLFKKENREHYKKEDSIPVLNVRLSDILERLKQNLIFNILKNFVQSKNKNIHIFTYDNFEKQFEKIFGVSTDNFKITIEKSDIDYKKYAINYKQAEKWFNKFNDIFKKLTINDVKDKNSIFWKRVG